MQRQGVVNHQNTSDCHNHTQHISDSLLQILGEECNNTDLDAVLSKEGDWGSGSNGTGQTRGSHSWQTEFLDSSRFWIPFFLTPVLFIVGVICNVVSIKIFAKSSMRSATNIYLTALAVSDLLYQVFSFTMSWKYYYIMRNVSLYWWYTPFGLWLTEASNATSVWIIVAFTVERFIAISCHLSRQIYCTENRTILVSILTFVSCLTFTGGFSYEWRGAFEPTEGNPLNETVYKLDSTGAWKEDEFQKSYQWIYTVYFFLIPVIILVGFNCFLGKFVRNTERDRQVMTRHRVFAVTQRQLNDNQVTTTLIAVSMMYIICQLPTNLLEIYTLVYTPTSGSIKESILMELRNIFKFMGRVNSICNILIYIALYRNFRKHFCTMYCRRQTRNLARNALR
ncbi:unnamed protein product [Orchesella dallaii]|uniref:G-protein coupled receptors family 1 profile domain-containing protein n=1 Tax=Orchesella dallaii TaxID=48710 RepID=A0ABP1RWK7_9HEXA